MGDTPMMQLVRVDLADPEFLSSLASYWYELGGRPSREWSERYVARARELEGSERYTFWGVAGGRRVGFAILRTEHDWLFPEHTVGYVAEFTILRPLRRKGHGRALWQSCASYLRSMGCVRIELDVLPTNGGAMLFWRKQGFALSCHHMLRSI